MKTKYDKVETNVEKICTALEDHRGQLMKMWRCWIGCMSDLLYFKELSMLFWQERRNWKSKNDRTDTADGSGKRTTGRWAVKDLTGAVWSRFEKKIP